MQDNANNGGDAQAVSQQQEVVLTPEAKAAALEAAIADMPEDVKAKAAGPSMNKVGQVIAGISVGRLRLMMADGRINPAEARAALAQAGLSPEEIEQVVEFTCRVLEHYARNVVPPEQSLAHAKETIMQKVANLGKMIASGAILPDIKHQPKDQSLTASTPGQEKTPDGTGKSPMV